MTEEKKQHILQKRLTRKEFLKRAATAAAGTALGVAGAEVIKKVYPPERILSEEVKLPFLRTGEELGRRIKNKEFSIPPDSKVIDEENGIWVADNFEEDAVLLYEPPGQNKEGKKASLSTAFVLPKKEEIDVSIYYENQDRPGEEWYANTSGKHSLQLACFYNDGSQEWILSYDNGGNFTQFEQWMEKTKTGEVTKSKLGWHFPEELPSELKTVPAVVQEEMTSLVNGCVTILEQTFPRPEPGSLP